MEEEEVPNTPLFVLCMLDDLFKTFGAIDQGLEEKSLWDETTYVTTEGPRGPVHWEEPEDDAQVRMYVARYKLLYTRAGTLDVEFHLPDIAYARTPVEVRVFFDTIVDNDKKGYHLDRVFAFRTLQEWSRFLNTELMRLKADTEAWVEKKEEAVKGKRQRVAM